MTTLIQLPNTPEIFAKVERRLAEAIHEQARLLSIAQNQRIEVGDTGAKVRPLRILRDALKQNLVVTVDADFYWSLTNETATTQKPEIA